MPERSRHDYSEVSKKMKKPIVAVIAVLSFIATGPGIESMASAEPRPAEAKGKKQTEASRGLTALEVTQNRLTAIGEAIQNDPNQRDGLSGIVVSPETASMTLYWRGPVPGSVQEIVSNASSQGLRVDVASAPYTLEELRSFQDSIVRSPGVEGSGITLIEVNPAGDGVTIGVRDSAEAAKHLPVVATSSIPVTYRQYAAQPLGRWADTVPFYGGAYITDNTTAACTSAFPAHNRTYPTDYYMLTAGHCFAAFGNLWFAGAGFGAPGLPEGQSWSVSSNADGASIRMDPTWGGTVAGGGGNRIYTGGVDQSGQGADEGNRIVKSKSANLNGDLVTASGARSGEVGRNRISNNQAIWSFTNLGFTWWVRGSRVTQLDGLGAVAPGDSGGPVFVYASGGVSARGIVSVGFGGGGATCLRVAQPPCFSEWGYGDIHIALDDMNLALNVG